jgi:putative heme-binding domain-containing protein
MQAARLLGRGLDRQREDQTLLAGLLAPRNPQEVQSAAVAALGQLREGRPADTLLEAWKALTPTLRSQALDVLLRRADGPGALLAAVADRRVAAGDVPLTARQRLLEHPSGAVRDRSARLFAGLVSADRAKVVAAYRPALRLKGDAARGRRHFEKHCAACHRLGGVGKEVGPDLAAARDKPGDWFLTALLDPSRAVEPRYLSYAATTTGGRVLTGVLAEEGGSSITLAGPGGERQVVLRANLEALVSTGKSFMPEGFEKELKPQDVADLIAYLKGQGPRGDHPGKGEVGKP